MNYDRVRHGLRGMFLNMLGQRERALAAYHESLAADPDHADTLRTLGWLEAQKERWAEAEAFYARAVEIEPDDAHTWFNLAFVRDKGSSGVSAGDRIEAQQ